MGSLVSTLLQDYRDLDLIFLYQKGDGACPDKASYDEYRQKAAECGKNIMLSDYDPRVKDVCRIKNYNIIELEFENDQSLDSGAYYKFIGAGGWKNYDYIFFMQEGAIFTAADTIGSTIRFAEKNNVHSLSSGHEKQRLPKDLFINWNTRSPNPTSLGVFHDRMIQATFDIFRRDKDFDTLYEAWKSDFPVENQHHIPDLGNKSRFLNSIRNKSYELLYKVSEKRIISNEVFKNVFVFIDSLLASYEGSISANSINKNHQPVIIHDPYIIVDRKSRKLSKTVTFKEEGSLKFHKANDNESQWFGCCCIHMLSRQFMQSFSDRLDEFKMYDVLELPFSATALEVIWGFLPSWLGYDKWFFDGIYRPRKNPCTREWEDFPVWMARYLNRYYRSRLYIEPEGDFIKISKMSGNLSFLKDSLNSYYFK